MRLLLTALLAVFSFSAHAAQLSPQGPFRAFDSNGDPCSGCKLYTYEAGTSTNKDTYTDISEDTANANPVVLDSDGYADIWLGDGAYKFILKDSSDATIWTLDDISGTESNAFGDQVTSLSSNTTITTAYENNLILTTSGPTLSLLSAATAREGFTFAVKNTDTGTTTVDPNGSETIDGSSTLTLKQGSWAIIYSDGTNWQTTNNNIDPVNITPGNDGEVLFTSGTTVQWTSEWLVPTGSVIFYASSTAPDGWLLGYGQDVSRTTYADLFSTIGTTFGAGDGSTTFNVPDCRGRVLAGEDDMGGSSANRLTGVTGSVNGDTFAGTGGTETHTLTAAEMPSHSHGVRSEALGGSLTASGSTANAFLFTTGGAASYFITSGYYGAYINTAGSDSAHNNVQPTLILGCIIKY